MRDALADGVGHVGKGGKEVRAVRGREEREGEEGREEKSRVRQARSEALICDATTAELHKTVAEKDKYISRLSEQAKAQVSYSLSHLSHSPCLSPSSSARQSWHGIEIALVVLQMALCHRWCAGERARVSDTR